jgi:hypothetical protein
MPHAPARRSLEAMLLTVLKKAWREREFEAADHVLRALECLAGEAGAHPHDGLSCLDEGYLIIAEEFSPKSSTKPCVRSGPHKKRQH